MQPYTDDFYAEIREHARRSARRIVPMVLDRAPAKSVVDVGCGLGTWLAVFMEHGVGDVLGIDGPHIDPEALEVPRDRFRSADLAAPLAVGRRFDLAVSLEVAEHLPAASADTFVTSLCALAPVVMFSAAVPSQGGVNHVNEQWPAYWAERFVDRGYRCVDCLRREVWSDPDVSWWYAQNVCLYVDGRALQDHPRLAERASTTPPDGLAHPMMVERNRARARYLEALWELFATVPGGSRVVVVDDGALLDRMGAARHFEWLPFLERGGVHWGAPRDDATAVQELERMQGEGATMIAFAWPALWWLEHYAAFARHLSANYERVTESANLVVYDLASSRSGRS